MTIHTATTVFMICFMAKMSYTKWSDLPEEEKRIRVTSMDREVAAEWLDNWRPDREFRFRPFVHNVPDTDSRLSSRNSSLNSIYSASSKGSMRINSSHVYYS